MILYLNENHLSILIVKINFGKFISYYFTRVVLGSLALLLSRLTGLNLNFLAIFYRIIKVTILIYICIYNIFFCFDYIRLNNSYFVFIHFSSVRFVSSEFCFSFLCCHLFIYFRLSFRISTWKWMNFASVEFHRQFKRAFLGSMKFFKNYSFIFQHKHNNTYTLVQTCMHEKTPIINVVKNSLKFLMINCIGYADDDDDDEMMRFYLSHWICDKVSFLPSCIAMHFAIIAHL